MAYKIYNTDGTTLLLLADNIVDQSATSLSLVGKNVNGYGQYMNNNFVKLLANSASTTSNPPRSPLTGQLWFDTTARRLKVYDGSFKPVTGASVSGFLPVNPVSGDLWFDSINYQLNAFNGTAWTIVGPAFQRRVGENGWVIPVGQVQDIYLLPHQVTLLKNYGKTLGVISSATFTTTYFTSATTLLASDTSDVFGGLTIFGSIQATKDIKINNTLTVDTIVSAVISNTNVISTVNLVTRNFVVNGTTTSISTTTGAIVVAGGVGIGGDLYVGGKIVAQELDIQYTTVTTISIKTDDVYTTYNTSSAYSTNTGAIIVAGGIGVAGGVFVGGTVTATSIISTNITATTGSITTLTATNITATTGSITTLTAANIRVSNSATIGSLLAGGLVYATNNLVVGSTTSEGGQVILGWPGINTMGSQSNSTWNIDVDGSNNFRIFSQNTASEITNILTASTSTTTSIVTLNNITFTNQGVYNNRANGRQFFHASTDNLAHGIGIGNFGFNTIDSHIYSTGGIRFITSGTIDANGWASGGVQFVSISPEGTIFGTAGIASTTTDTGSLVISGGVGISGNVFMGKVLSLTVSTAEPASPAVGMFAVADRVTWDPASKGSGNAYPVFYNGSTWNALY
jgi:hypothetical protein